MTVTDDGQAKAVMTGLTRLRRFLWLTVAAILAGLIALYFTTSRERGPMHLSTPLHAKPFVLTATDGTTFSSEKLQGWPFALYFGFTRCPDVCPTTLANLAALRARLGQDGARLKIVFVSVDPQHDTPSDIGSYLKLFDTPIIGLTGTESRLASITADYGIFVKKVPMKDGDFTIDHTASVLLFDAQHRLASTISHQEDPKTALRKLENLVR